MTPLRRLVFLGLALSWPSLAVAADAPAAASEVGIDPVLAIPISPLIPGDPPPVKKLANPVAGDPAAIERGMQDFIAFNCVGCHAANGGGGMGPSLSDDKWIYGSSPSNVFLTIFQGRPNGMPAWGQTLPTKTIWDLVAYVEGLAKKPDGSFGRTVSRDPTTAPKEQTPAEFVTTPNPWSFTQPFTNGQQPKGP